MKQASKQARKRKVHNKGLEPKTPKIVDERKKI